MLEEKKEQFALGEEDLEQVVGAGDENKEDLGVGSLDELDGPKDSTGVPR